MLICSRCEGFVPSGHEHCPHCDAAIASDDRGALAGRLAKGAAKVATAGAMMATLMACYGAGYYDDEPQPQPQPEACELVTNLPADGYVEGDTMNEAAASNGLLSSCGGSGTPERIYHFEPGADAGQSGTLTVLWQADSSMTVYVLDQCVDGIELACDGGETSGTLEVPIDALAPMEVVIDGNSAYSLQVFFTPGPAPPG